MVLPDAKRREGSVPPSVVEREAERLVERTALAMSWVTRVTALMERIRGMRRWSHGSLGSYFTEPGMREGAVVRTAPSDLDSPQLYPTVGRKRP